MPRQAGAPGAVGGCARRLILNPGIRRFRQLRHPAPVIIDAISQDGRAALLRGHHTRRRSSAALPHTQRRSSAALPIAPFVSGNWYDESAPLPPCFFRPAFPVKLRRSCRFNGSFFLETNLPNKKATRFIIEWL